MFHRKWLYHKDHEPVLVESEEQLEALGKGWVDQPVEKAKEIEAEPLEPVGLAGLKEDELIKYIKSKKLSALSPSKLKALKMAELLKIAEGK